MSFYSLLTGKLCKRKRKRKLKNRPAEYVGRFYRNLANNVNNFLGSDFYEQIASGYGMLSADIQNNILATGDFAKGMQTDINHYVTNDKINSASFRQKLDPISKNILRRQNLLELVLKDISMFDAENPIVVSLLKELDVGKIDIASELIKKAPRQPGVEFAVWKRLEKLKNRLGPKDDDDNFNLLPPPSPPRPSSLGPQPPWPPLGPPPAPPFFKPPWGKILEPFQQPTVQPRPPPPLKPKGVISIPPAPSTPPLSPSDYFLLGSSARSVSPAPRPLTPTPPPLTPLAFTLSNNLSGSQTQTLTREKKK